MEYSSSEYLRIGKWISPTVSGNQPPPCMCGTLTLVDDHRAVLFGGSNEVSTNDVYTLDIRRMVSLSDSYGARYSHGIHALIIILHFYMHTQWSLRIKDTLGRPCCPCREVALFSEV